MFTKQHYKLLAETIGKSQNLAEFTEKLIKIFQNDNEAFDTLKFREYLAKVVAQSKSP